MGIIFFWALSESDSSNEVVFGNFLLKSLVLRLLQLVVVLLYDPIHFSLFISRSFSRGQSSGFLTESSLKGSEDASLMLFIYLGIKDFEFQL